MKKYVITIIVIAIAVAFFLISRNSNNTPAVEMVSSQNSTYGEICTPDVLKLATSTGMIYVNTNLHFSIYLPKGWIVPKQDDNDPHFYNCSTHDGFEIHAVNNPSSLYSYEHAEYVNPKDTRTLNVYDNFIKNAVVREFSVVDPEEGGGWNHWNAILFDREKKAFFFAAYKTIDQYSFASTFTLQ